MIERCREVLVQVVDGGLVVHDRRRHRRYRLGPDAAAVWDVCDGVTHVDEVVERCRAAGQTIDATVARRALDELAGNGLVTGAVADDSPRQSRRRFLSIVGAGVAAPLVGAVVWPVAAAAGGRSPTPAPQPTEPTPEPEPTVPPRPTTTTSTSTTSTSTTSTTTTSTSVPDTTTSSPATTTSPTTTSTIAPTTSTTTAAPTTVPPTVAPTTPPTVGPELPETGGSSGRVAVIGAALAAAGAMVMRAARRSPAAAVDGPSTDQGDISS